MKNLPQEPPSRDFPMKNLPPASPSGDFLMKNIIPNQTIVKQKINQKMVKSQHMKTCDLAYIETFLVNLSRRTACS